jgi:hypothetical protein
VNLPWSGKFIFRTVPKRNLTGYHEPKRWGQTDVESNHAGRLKAVATRSVEIASGPILVVIEAPMGFGKSALAALIARSITEDSLRPAERVVIFDKTIVDGPDTSAVFERLQSEQVVIVATRHTNEQLRGGFAGMFPVVLLTATDLAWDRETLEFELKHRGLDQLPSSLADLLLKRCEGWPALIRSLLSECGGNIENSASLDSLEFSHS